MRRLTAAFVCTGALFCATHAQAHMMNMTRMAVAFPGDGTFHATLEIDLTLLLGGTAPYRELAALPRERAQPRMEALAAELARSIEFTFDDVAVVPALSAWRMPDVPLVRYDDADATKMTTFELTAPVPAQAASFRVKTASMTPAEFPLALTLLVPEAKISMTRWLELGGQASRPFALGGFASLASAGASATAGPKDRSYATHGTYTTYPTDATDRRLLEMSGWQKALVVRALTAGEFLRLGFLHIIPRGWDHVLFVLGLFFLGTNWRVLAWQTTVFTIAHTTTLGLSSLGIVRLSPSIVEPLIAFSIAYVAVENIVRPRLGPGRLVVVFAFGLLHGLGFASSLSEVPLPRDEFLTSLFAFNFGVDFGQLAVLAVAFLTVGWFRGREFYRRAIVVPSCAVIAAVGLFWMVQRIFF